MSIEEECSIHRAFRYRLYPTPEQEEELRQFSGVCRLVYNLGYEQRRDFWRQYKRAHGRPITYFGQSAELTQLRAEYDWIAAVPVEATAYALQDLDRAFANFFAGRAKYPAPRRKDQGHGFRVQGRYATVRALSAKWAEVHVSKLGKVRFRLTRPIQGTVRNVSIKCTAGRWHVSFAADWKALRPARRAEAAGIDLGVVRTVTLSTGEHHQAPRTAVQAIARAQRSLARKKKGSARFEAQKRFVARLSAKAARQRADWSHKLSTDLALRFGVIAIEDLNIKAMTASAAGTLEQPGRYVAQKRGLNRAILAQSWGQLTAQLAYKLDAAGGTLVAVDPKYTSQTCAACGVADARSRESQADFRCVHCGHRDNADVNAAREIRRRGTARLGVEADLGRTAKRQLEEAQRV